MPLAETRSHAPGERHRSPRRDPRSIRASEDGQRPELLAWALRDWCRVAGTVIAYSERGSPWEDPFVERFNGRVRNELLNVEEIGSLLEAQVVVEPWRVKYNHLPAPLVPRRSHARRVCKDVDHHPTSAPAADHLPGSPHRQQEARSSPFTTGLGLEVRPGGSA